ncbi:MAG: EAL domain-containing protein [Actinomycetota bacterium]|nr:EAL domain-containing protein [Actinomycetota bacterium]
MIGRGGSEDETAAGTELGEAAQNGYSPEGSQSSGEASRGLSALALALKRASDAERKLADVVDSTDDGVITKDLVGTITSFNPAAERMYGYTAGEVIGRSIAMLGLADHPEEIPGLLERVARGEVCRVQTRRARRDGSELEVALTISPIRDSVGDVVGASTIVRDISEQKATERRLQEVEQQFHRSFDDALIGMQTFDLDGRYMRVNDAFCAIVGYPRDELVGRLRQRITHPEDLAPDAEALRALLAGERKSYTRDKRYIHAMAHPVWASIGVTLIRDADGQPMHFIGQAQDITERRRYEHQLKHMADHDPLTGLLNRRSFEHELEGHIARIKRSAMTGAVLMIDLDNFKYYNDTEGHNAGDELIVRIAHGLRGRLRESDVCARLGGDEFAVLLPQGGRDGAERVARELVEHVRGQAPTNTLGGQKRVTASVGIACFASREPATVDEMMTSADLAMYEAKDAGRNGVAHYRTEQHDRPRIESHMKWASEITDALSHDRFELVAQPIVPLSGNGPTQYELLLRMRLADGDLVPPGTFLYVAERLGLIREIDRWVADRAITMLSEQRAGGRDLHFGVNLSGHTTGDPELLQLIERRLVETGVPPDRLMFEITETAAVSNIAQAASFADHLSELGCKFALDDFGAGFGSFYYLKHLPFDYLKIDGEFVAHCAESEIDRTLISAVVQIARGLGKLTVAEFVEHQETVEVLARLGVDYGQGYHLGRPAPLEQHLAGTATPRPAN